MDNINNLESNWEKIKSSFWIYAPSIASALISAILILFIGLWLINVINRVTHRILNKKNLDISVQSFLENLINWTLKILLFIIVISKLGIQTSSFVAMIGAAGLAIGLALQGSLSNFAGGLLILLFKPFKVGDYISASNGISGTVKYIDIFHTKLTTPQNQLIVAPNGELSNSSITNYSIFPTRSTWFDIGVSYDADLKQVKEILLEVAENHPMALKDPAPQIVITELGDNAVNVSVRVSARNSDFWTMNEELIIGCKSALDAAGINIPYPQRDLHIINKV